MTPSPGKLPWAMTATLGDGQQPGKRAKPVSRCGILLNQITDWERKRVALLTIRDDGLT